MANDEQDLACVDLHFNADFDVSVCERQLLLLLLSSMQDRISEAHKSTTVFNIHVRACCDWTLLLWSLLDWRDLKAAVLGFLSSRRRWEWVMGAAYAAFITIALTRRAAKFEVARGSSCAGTNRPSYTSSSPLTRPR
jgi:hypothetical protein